MLDVLIRNATVVDGSGRPSFRADLAVKDGIITGVGDLSWASAAKTIDASDLIAAPGFIDSHAHSDFAVMHNPPCESHVCQGVTTEISCNCGKSPFPVLPNPLPLKNIADTVWTTPKDFWHSQQEYFEIFERQGCGINLMPLVGHNNIRCSVIGMENRPCTPDELEQMKALLRESFELGIPGFSTGLTYTPGQGAEPEEIIELAKVVAEYGGMYTTHMSNYSGVGLESAMDFAAETAWKSGMRLEFSHIAPHSEDLYGKGQWMCGLLEKYQKMGVDACADVPSYPTIGVWHGPRAIFPRWLYNWKTPWPEQAQKIKDAILDPGKNSELRAYIEKLRTMEHVSFLGQFFGFHDWDHIFVKTVRKGSENEKYIDWSIAQIAKDKGVADPTDVYFDLCVTECEDFCSVNILEHDEDRRILFNSPYTFFGSDVYAISPDDPYSCFSRFQLHPRWFGHAVYVIETIYKKNHWLTLEGAIHKMTGGPARHFNLHDRGLLRSGYKADIVLFNLENMHETATYFSPVSLPTGVEHVFVNGVEEFAHGRFTGNLGGVALLRGKGVR